MKKTMFIVFSLFLLLLPINVFALTLDEAKANGQLGETPSGYLEVVSPPGSPEAITLRDEINAKRKSKYQEIAKTRGSSLSVVEQLAGKQAVEKTPSGQYVQLENKQWVKK